MTKLTQDEINQIIDLTKDNAKAACERIYNETIKSIGDNPYFKKIIDTCFDEIYDIEIKSMKSDLNSFFKYPFVKGISVQMIHNIMEGRRKIHNGLTQFYIAPRHNNHLMQAAVSDIITKSVEIAFTEKLAEYLATKVLQPRRG